jgi:hypothetical protein
VNTAEKARRPAARRARRPARARARRLAAIAASGRLDARFRPRQAAALPQARAEVVGLITASGQESRSRPGRSSASRDGMGVSRSRALLHGASGVLADDRASRARSIFGVFGTVLMVFLMSIAVVPLGVSRRSTCALRAPGAMVRIDGEQPGGRAVDRVRRLRAGFFV